MSARLRRSLVLQVFIAIAVFLGDGLYNLGKTVYLSVQVQGLLCSPPLRLWLTLSTVAYVRLNASMHI